MVSCVALQAQLISIMEVLSKAAVAQICRVVEEGYAELRLEVSRRKEENETLRMELCKHRIQTETQQAADTATDMSEGRKVRVKSVSHSDHAPVSPKGDSLPPVMQDQSAGVGVKGDGTHCIKGEDPPNCESPGDGRPASGRQRTLQVICDSGSLNMAPKCEPDVADPSEQKAAGPGCERVACNRVDFFHHQHGSPESENELSFCAAQTNPEAVSSEPPNIVPLWKSSPVETGSSAHGANRGPNATARVTLASQGLNERDLFSQTAVFPAHMDGRTVSRLQLNERDWNACGFARASESRDGGDGRRGAFVCACCGKSFSRRNVFNRHQKCHAGEKPFSCPQCDKRFAQLSNLIMHRRVHTGEKPYRCSHCGRGFAQSRYLVTHQRVHTGEKPYRCSQCGKRFAQSNNLLRHQSVHTGKKPFGCSECGKQFSQHGNLTRHLSVHFDIGSQDQNL